MSPRVATSIAGLDFATAKDRVSNHSAGTAFRASHTERRATVEKLRKWSLTLIATTSLVAVVLLVTGWGSAMAAQVTSIFVNNDAAHPVPVAQQGTADVNVKNSSLTVTPSAATGQFNVLTGDVGVLAGDRFGSAINPAVTVSLITITGLQGSGLFQIRDAGHTVLDLAFTPADHSLVIPSPQRLTVDEFVLDCAPTSTTSCKFTVSMTG